MAAQKVRAELEAALRRKSVPFEFFRSRDYHDRFIIVTTCGLAMGTSFNGVGKLFFPVDYRKPTDATDIAQAVREACS